MIFCFQTQKVLHKMSTPQKISSKKKNSKKKASKKKKKNEEPKESATLQLREEEFRKGTPLAPVIWERDEIKESLKQNPDNNDWLNKIALQVGQIANQIETEKVDGIKLEDELIKTAALCLVWIENIRISENRR